MTTDKAENKKESSWSKLSKKKLKTKEVDDLKKEKEELTNQLQRLQAEFENFKKRTDKENKSLVEYAKKDIIKEILPIVDSFEMSLTHKDKSDEFTHGMEMIFAQLMKLLTKEGLLVIDCLGKQFDPYKHEVLLTEESSDNPDDTVIDELQKGYVYKEMVIRHSKVKVSVLPKLDGGKDGNKK